MTQACSDLEHLAQSERRPVGEWIKGHNGAWAQYKATVCTSLELLHQILYSVYLNSVTFTCIGLHKKSYMSNTLKESILYLSSLARVGFLPKFCEGCKEQTYLWAEHG